MLWRGFKATLQFVAWGDSTCGCHSAKKSGAEVRTSTPLKETFFAVPSLRSVASGPSQNQTVACFQ